MGAALALFGEHGYEATSIEAITAHAGVAVGAFYQHFASKRQLLLVLMAQLLTDAAAFENIAPPAGQRDIRAIIAYLVRQGLRVDWAYSGALRAWHEAALHDQELRAWHARIEIWMAAQLADLLRRVLAAPNARTDVDIDTFASLLNFIFWRLAETPLADPEAVIATLTDMIYRMLFAAPT